jgi:hypothetical protein
VVTTSASETAFSSEGSLGSGAGESSGKLSWAKTATRARPEAAVSPRKAKTVLRIRSGRPCPARLGSRNEARSLLWKRWRTTSCIGRSGRRQ